MKRTLFILTALVAVNVASAQFFVKAGLGYNLSAVSQARAITVQDSSGANYQTASRYSYGKGLNVQAALGYDFTQNLGIQLGAAYLLAPSPLEISTSSIATNGVAITTTQVSQAEGLLTLMPAFTMKSNGDKVNLYSRVGLTIPVGGEIQTDVTSIGTGINQENTYINKGKFSLGYNAALGLGLPLSDKLSFWTELTGNFLNISADTRTMTKYTANGVDRLPGISTRNKETIYVDKIDASTSLAGADPKSEIADDSPFSSIGISAGIKFSFGNSREKRREGEK